MNDADFEATRSLTDNILAVPDEVIADTIEPFVSDWLTVDDPGWRQRMKGTRRSVYVQYLRHTLSRKLFGRRRGQVEISEVYSTRWATDQFAPFKLPILKPKGGGAWQWGERCLRLKVIGGRRARLLYLMWAIEALKPRRALEVGFGEGLNLILLANRFPEIEFHGLELTEGGVRTAQSMVGPGTLPDHLVEFSPQPLHRRDAHRQISFLKGSAALMPYSNKSFDLVFTNLALEQMEEIRSEALSEISRVASRHALFIEPFRDYNSNGIQRAYVRSLDYFQGSIAGLREFDFDVIEQTTNLPSKIFINIGVVLARKVS